VDVTHHQRRQCQGSVDAFKAEMDTFTPIDKADGTQVWVKTLTTRDENADPVSADAAVTGAVDSASTDSVDAAVTEIAVISLMRAAKERSINDGRTKRYLADLTRLCLAIEAGTYRVPKTVERRIGRLANKHRQVARNYEVNVVLDADGKAASLSYRPKPEAIKNTEALYGAYVIETNKEGLSKEEIWHLYMTPRSQPLVLLGPPASGSCDKFQAAAPSRAPTT